MIQKTGSMPAVDASHTEGHPSLSKYVGIAIFLAIITGIEVAIYYIDFFSSVLVPMLVVFSAVKFVTVVGYFMHLRFDGKLLSMIFGAALVIALAVYIAVDLMMDFRSINIFYGGQ